MIDRLLVGRESEPWTVEVEPGMIRRFAEALGDPNPIFSDEAAAQAAGFATIVAPPTFPVALVVNDRFRHSLDLGTRLVLHSEQQIEYGRPLLAGERLILKSRVADVQERAGASGPMDVLVVEDEARDAQGASVFRTRSTLVLRRG
jgi:acyl dehydratase